MQEWDGRLAPPRPVRLACTAAAACGYGTGVGVSSAETAAWWRAWVPGRADQFHRPGRAGARGGWPAGGAPAGDGDRAGRGGQDRLAGEVARAVAGRFADGAWLAQLAPVSDAAQVARVVAAALGVRQQPGVPAAEALARVLARQQLLLVLDNCEHVIGAAAELCAGLLAACDDIRVLATSREPLRTAGEARYRLRPLALPGR